MTAIIMTTSLRFFFCMLCLFLTPGVGFSSPLAPPSLPEIHGNVIEWESLRPIVGATISWAGTHLESKTELGGKFSLSIDGISWPAYLQVTASGFESKIIEVLQPIGDFSIAVSKEKGKPFSAGSQFYAKEKIEKMEKRVRQEAAILANQAENLSLQARWVSQMANQKPPTWDAEKMWVETQKLKTSLTVMQATYNRLEKESAQMAGYKLDPGIEVSSSPTADNTTSSIEKQIQTQKEEIQLALTSLLEKKKEGEEMLKMKTLSESEWQSLLKELQLEYAALDLKCKTLIKLEEKAHN